MKTLFIVALGAAGLLAFPAQAADPQTPSQAGHYEWRQPAQYGPRTLLQAPRRIWVTDGPEVADCRCDMMKIAAAKCMVFMHGMASPASDQSVG